MAAQGEGHLDELEALKARNFASKVDGFKARRSIWWCVTCQHQATEKRQRGKQTETRCGACGERAHYFPSAGEHRRYLQLRTLARAGEILDLRLQPAFPIEINGRRICTYRADFGYRRPDGCEIIEDYKGRASKSDAASALRRKLAQAVYGISIAIVEARR